jgi:quercetin dioxygenase-like cupin family protein
MTAMLKQIAALVVLALAGAPVALRAEEKAAAPPPAATQAAPGIKRTILQKFDVPGTTYEVIFMKVEFVPDFVVDRHTHPGPEASYVLDGEITLLLDGQPPKNLKPGDSTYFPPAIIHSGKVGPKGVVLLNSYTLEKGKPFLTKVDANGVPIPDPPK